MFKKQFTIIALAFVLLSGATMAQNYSGNREEIPAKYKWDFSDIYENWDDWEKGLKELETKMNKITEYKGTLSQGADNLLEVQKLYDDMNLLSYKVYRYPQLQRDTDTRNQEISSKLQQVQILFAKFGTATSWISPEMLEIPWATMEKWLNSNDEFAPYRFGIEDLYRQQKHVLSEDKEMLLSFGSQFNGTPSSIYSEMSTSDVKFPEVKLSDGETIKATNGNYSKVLATNSNQADRKIIFDAHYGVYKDYENTYAAIYNAICQRDWAGAQARNYTSSVEAQLEGNNIPVAVYKNLVSTVKKNTAPLQKYIRLRKKILGLKEYHNYDGSINIIEFNKTYPYEQAQEWVYESVAPLGEHYQANMKKALGAGWIDVFENDGKRSGAYSANVYGVHPFMLMNYNETMNNVFTLGHELGHTMHTVLANENQPFATSSYTIFVAEVASTFNEALLLDYLLERTTDPVERIALIQQAINGISGTFYFQTLLADFELQVHTMVEQGQPITAQVLNAVMKDLFKAYYGDEIVHDELINSVWARIPHMFRSPFYVYQYATCFVSSAQFYKSVTTGTEAEKDAAKEKYLNLLKSGGNDYPMAQLKEAGVDLTKPETMTAVVEQLTKLVDQLETEIDKLN